MQAALCLEQNQPLSVEEVTPIDPGPGDLIVRITASGVCHSDLSVINGTLPAGRVVLGHEGTGVVEKVGSDITRPAGGRPRDRLVHPGVRRVLVLPARPVQPVRAHLQRDVRAAVRRADGEEMVAMTGLGTFAEMMTVQRMSVVKVETDLPDEQLALIGCGVTTGVGAALNTARGRARLDRRSDRVRRGRPGGHPGRADRRRRAHHRRRPGGAEARARAAERRHRRGRSDRHRPDRSGEVHERRARRRLHVRSDRQRRDRAPGARRAPVPAARR